MSYLTDQADLLNSDGSNRVERSREDDDQPLLPENFVTIIDNEIKAISGGFIFRGERPVGIQYSLEGDKVIVQNISNEGSISLWNQTNQEKVKVGDEIVAVFEGVNRVDLRTFESTTTGDKNRTRNNKSSFIADYLLSNTNPNQAVTLELLHPNNNNNNNNTESQSQSGNKMEAMDLGDRLIYSVTLSKPLGIRIDNRNTKNGVIIVVSKIQPTGAAASWNKTVKIHSHRIRLNDRVIAFYDRGGRVDVSQWPGREIADRIHGLEDDSVTLEFERTENDGACCCLIL